MKTVTNNFKEEIRKLGREIDFKIFLYANDKLITQNNNFIITQDNLNLVVEQFNQEEIEYTINSDEIYNVSVVNRGELLSTMMKEVDFEVSKELKVGDVISCEFGLKVGNSYEYVDYGKYMIYEKDFNEDTKTYSYVAYDRMLLTMREIPNPSNFENKNILSVIQEICTITNLEFNGTSETALTYPNLNKVINQGTFTDLVMTYRDMLDMICQALGLSMIVEDNELVLKDINEKEKTLVGKNSLYLEDAMEQNVINYSVDGVSEQDSYEGRNLYNYKDSNNVGSGITVDDEGWITLTWDKSNDSNNSYVNYFTNNLKLDYSTTYSIFTEIKNVNLNSGNATFVVHSRDNNEGQFESANTNYGLNSLSNNSVKKVNATTRSSFTSNKGLRSYFYLPAGSKGTFTFRLSVLKDTSISVDDFVYEKYVGGTPSPNPDYPQEIKTIPSIRNLLITDVNSNAVSSYENNTFTFKGDLSVAWYGYIGKANLEAGKKYIIFYTNPFVYGRIGMTLSSNEYPKEANNPNTTLNFATAGHLLRYDRNRITFTSNANQTVYFWFCSDINNANKEAFTTSIQLEEGTVAHEYIPYGHYARIKVTGKNLFDEVWENGGINSSNGSNESNTDTLRIRTKNYIPVKPNTKYILTFDTTEVTSDNARIALYTKNKSFINVLWYDDGSNGKWSFTTTNDTHYIRFTAKNSTTDWDLTNIQFQLEEGEISTNYEPYKENEVLIDMSKPNLFYGELESGNLNSANGNNETNTNRIRTKEFIEVSSSNTYYINSSVSLARIIQYDANKNFIRYNAGSDNPLTTTSTTKYIRFSLLTTDTSTNVNIFEGTSPTPYYELCSNTDKTVKDTLSIDTNGNCSIIKNIGKRVLNGSESWELQWQQSGFRTSVPDIKKTTSSSQPSYVMSNYYTSDTQDQVFAKNYGICNRVNQSQIIIKNTDVSATVDDFKTWLSTHNTVVQYELATPETITLPNTQIPLFEGINHITLVDDLETDTSIVYNSSDLAVEEIDETYLNDTNVNFG